MTVRLMKNHGWSRRCTEALVMPENEDTIISYGQTKTKSTLCPVVASACQVTLTWLTWGRTTLHTAWSHSSQNSPDSQESGRKLQGFHYWYSVHYWAAYPVVIGLTHSLTDRYKYNWNIYRAMHWFNETNIEILLGQIHWLTNNTIIGICRFTEHRLVQKNYAIPSCNN